MRYIQHLNFSAVTHPVRKVFQQVPVSTHTHTHIYKHKNNKSSRDCFFNLQQYRCRALVKTRCLRLIKPFFTSTPSHSFSWYHSSRCHALAENTNAPAKQCETALSFDSVLQTGRQAEQSVDFTPAALFSRHFNVSLGEFYTSNKQLVDSFNI